MDNRIILTPFFLDDPLPGLDHLSRNGWLINRPALTANETQQRLIELYHPLSQSVAKAVRSQERPVSFAGDCCTSLGVLAGLQAAEMSPTLLWFDAHGDFNTWETTPSGFLGGMPLAMLVGRGEQTIAHGLGLKTYPESMVILTDARDLDPEESRALANSEVKRVDKTSDYIDMALPAGPLYVHFDTDIINPQEAPAMNYPAPGGPSIAVLKRIFQSIARSGQLRAVSISSWNPSLDKEGVTEMAVMELITVLLTA